jgi:pyruvate-formate lyase-activating enzyme
VATVKTRRGPDGVHIFDRVTGLNLLVEEVTVPDSQWDRAPRQVSIALTNACDLECPYCYAPKIGATLDIARVCAWAAELYTAGCLGIGLGGGEPTLFRRLPELCRQITTRTSLAVTMTTHGHRWTPQLSEALTGNVQFVRVSVDGVGATYEKLRHRPFSALVERLTLISRSFNLGVNCVVNAATFEDLTSVAELSARVGAAELLLLPERPVNGRPGAGRGLVALLCEWIGAYRGPVPLAIGSSELGDLPTAVPLPLETGLRSYAHIDALGFLKRTSYEPTGERIDERGVLNALDRLQERAA